MNSRHPERKQKSARWRGIYLLCLALLTLGVTGCTIGLKEKNQIVMVSPVPIPESANGVPVIRTNKLIPLTILKKPDVHFEQNIGGYVVVDPWFYEQLLECYRRQYGDAERGD